MSRKYLFYFIYLICILGISVSIIGTSPILLLFWIFCVILNAIFHNEWKEEDYTEQLRKQVEEDDRLLHEQYQLAMKNKKAKEFLKYLNDTVDERFKRKMLYEVSRRK